MTGRERSQASHGVPALVLGSGFNGLGVARSLGAMGVPVYMADTEVTRFEMHSRYVRRLRVEALEGEPLLHALAAWAETHFASNPPVLVLTQERTVDTIGAVQASLKNHYRFLLPEAEILRALMHKNDFDAVARRQGLRVPRTVHVRDESGIDAALDLAFPLVIKPGLHAREYQGRFRKAYRVVKPDEARELLGRILQVLPDVVAQEWIPGTDSDIYFCLQQLSAQNRVEKSFVGRKIRSWPPEVGGTASCISAPERAELAATTERFFAQVGMCGLAGMEYKRHAETGEFVAIEPTVGRTDYQEEVATLNGVNLPYAYYRSVLGLEAESESGENRGVVWRDGEADWQSEHTAGQTVHGWPAAHGRIYDALWRLNDPQPWLARSWHRLAGKLHRLYLDGAARSKRSTRMTMLSIQTLRDRLLPPHAELDDAAVCQALADWIAAAQDASGCGGVCAYYDLLGQHWAAAYPETTGYIIPTLFDYARDAQAPEFRTRALRMADWECVVQLPDGGVRAGLMDAPQVCPTVFNTGQVLFGWARAFEETGEPRYRDALRRAADWLIAAQDEDGAWRRFASPFASHALNTYNTRTAFGLVRAGQTLGESRYQEAAQRNVAWALRRAEPNGWLPDNGLDDNERPLTHTIAYALRGILEVSAATGVDGLDTVLSAARALASAQRSDGALPGRLDRQWRPAVRWSCLTGNAQMAIVWLRLVQLTGDASLLSAAGKAIRFNVGTMKCAGAPGIAGGVQGSHPVGAEYMRYRYPSWAAKFMLDALLLWRRMT